MNGMKWDWIDLLILFSIIITVLVTIVTYEEARWVGHAVAGSFSLILMVIIMTTGAMLTGRLRRRENVRIFPLHRKVSIWFSLYVIGVFFFGLAVTASHGEPVLTSVHGLFGLVVAVLAAAQVMPSLIIRNRAPLKGAHRIIGYLLAPFLTLQVIIGVYAAVIGTGREVALLHSLIGGISLLLFAWIIVEIRYPGPKSPDRAAIAGYIAALLNVIGCWIIGGYNYLTVYRGNIRGIILSGPQPWAHEIVMEAKEHIFLFLPVVSIMLALGLYTVTRDRALMEEAQIRKALIVTAGLAFFMVILMFVMGSTISNAALAAQGGEP